MGWKFINKEVFFVEIDDKILKFDNSIALGKFIKIQPKGKKWILYYVEISVEQCRK